MLIDNRLTFYLCREVTRNTVMYLILPAPRRNSSLCTFVLLYVRPDDEQQGSTSKKKKFHLRETSLMASHPQPTLVDANLSGNPRYAPDNHMFNGPSNEQAAFGIADSSHDFLSIHPSLNHPGNPSDPGNNFAAYRRSAYTVDTGFPPGQHSTVVSNVHQHEDLGYRHGWSETRSPNDRDWQLSGTADLNHGFAASGSSMNNIPEPSNPNTQSHLDPPQYTHYSDSNLPYWNP
jgi:hypothetical protein